MHFLRKNYFIIIKQHLPKEKSPCRPSLNPRTVFNAIFLVLDSGAKWRYIPKEYCNWNSFYRNLSSLFNDEFLEKILQFLAIKTSGYHAATKPQILTSLLMKIFSLSEWN